jgi:hypothetical protein
MPWKKKALLMNSLPSRLPSSISNFQVQRTLSTWCIALGDEEHRLEFKNYKDLFINQKCIAPAFTSPKLEKDKEC